jgi:hypothetical protein
MSVVSTESRGKYEDERKLAGAAKMTEERKAATNAKAILGWLTPANARTDQLIFVLRNAANLAKTASLTRLESRRALDALRGDAASSLNAVCGLLDKGRLTQDAIDLASQAVTEWLSALASKLA